MTGLYQVYENGQTNIQIGNNTNLFDWTYVGNVAHAHLLAADKLDTQPPAPPLSSLEKLPATSDEVPPLNPDEVEMVSRLLPQIGLTTGSQRIPTCEARPLGPYIEFPPNGAEIEAAFNSPIPARSNRPVVRTRFDQFSEGALKRAKLHKPDVHPLQVAGQVFFITNGEPCYFWDFPRTIWRQLDNYFPEKRKQRSSIKLPKSVGLLAASGSEWASWMIGKEPTFTRFKVTFSCASRWHNIEKARRVLGYEPVVGIEEGAKRLVEWWHTQYVAGNHQQKH
jgi:sterol-4alpha-carboxylate 3-dehydrogenase (decarboxylating)